MVSIVRIVEQGNPNNLLILPITPQALPETGQADIRSFHVEGAGGFSKPIGRAEQHFPLQGLLPGSPRQALPIVHDWRPPQDIADQVRDWLERMVALRYQPSTLAGPLDVAVYINHYKFERTGWAGDLTFDLELVEWRLLNVRVDDGSPSAAAASDTPGDAEPALPISYTVMPGDTLTFIAKQVLGDTARWREIYDINQDLIGDDPSLIEEGQVLAIPGGTAPATDVPVDGT